MLIELHLIQNFAPSNLNRDDTNNPKDCEFGGVRRARISSQCIKRAVREHPVFAKITGVPVSSRTRYMTRQLVQSLANAGKPIEQAQAAAEAFAAQYVKMDAKKKDRTSVLIYLSQGEIQMITAKLLAKWETLASELAQGKGIEVANLAKEVFKATQNRTGAPDIAMFGRMLAEKPDLNLDAACQVAHAISTHRVNMEMDFYTAVDDLLRDDEAGAGMMGVTGFNSACFYRYACISWEQLLANLDNDAGLARKTVEGFLHASALAVPSGKQTSFAAQNPPDFILAIVREDGQAWSLANAFETPVYPGKTGLVATSITALDRYWGQLMAAYGSDGITLAVLTTQPEAPLTSLKSSQVQSLPACIQAVLSALPQE